MLKEWLRGGSSSNGDESSGSAPKASTRMTVAADVPLEESKEDRRLGILEKKMTDLVSKGSMHQNKTITYDLIFKPIQELLNMQKNEINEGIQIHVARHAQNAMITSKWDLGKPQTALWEVEAKMNSFSDMIAASWSTANRYQLMYQNVFPFGASFVAQIFAQSKGNATQGSIFSMLQYPWSFGGCSQIQYFKGQHFCMSHLQQMVRGVYFGSMFMTTTGAPTHTVDLTHAFLIQNHKKSASFMGEINPQKGTWKLGAVGKDWGLNTKGVAELEYSEAEQGQKASSLMLGVSRAFVGGAKIATALVNFQQLHINLQIPFGGKFKNANQMEMQIKCLYDLHSGGLKHGIVFNA